jgi:hypothetical protein
VSLSLRAQAPASAAWSAAFCSSRFHMYHCAESTARPELPISTGMPSATSSVALPLVECFKPLSLRRIEPSMMPPGSRSNAMPIDWRGNRSFKQQG